MDPLIGVAAAIYPEIMEILMSDRDERLHDQIIASVKETTRTADPLQANQTLMANGELANVLRTRLAAIASEAKKRADQRRTTHVYETKARDAEARTQAAEMKLVRLVRSGAGTSWTGPIISGLVVIGFLWLLGYVVSNPDTLRTANRDAFQVINIAIGALVVAFTTVVNFWLGSSEGSRRKDIANYLESGPGVRTAVSSVADAQRGPTETARKP